MAVLAVATIVSVNTYGNSTFAADVSFAGMPAGSGMSGVLFVEDLSPATYEAQIAAAVQSYMEGQSVTFGETDVVQVI